MSTNVAPALPSTRDENWRYAPLRGLERLQWTPPAALAAEAVESARAVLGDPAPATGTRWTFIDGHFAAALSSGPAPQAERAPQTDAAPTDTAVDAVDGGADLAFARLNRRHAPSPVTLRIPADTTRDLEVACVALSVGHPAFVIEVGQGAKLQLVERHLGAANALANLWLQLRLAPGARVEHSRLLQPAAGTRHFETLQLRLEAGAELHLVQLTTGGAATRSTALVELAGADATLRWHAAMLGAGQQAHDAYVRVTHDAPSARTEQAYRGIAADRSRIAFNGHMRVTSRARGANSDQTLRSLLAGPAAEANARPQLEIDTDDVRASHGATVGKLDADMLFYLLSRGIAPDAAESLLKWAFVSDVLAKLPDAALRARFEAAIAPLLPGAEAARSLA
ncbi:MAG: SufB/SufD family protein [Gammaproteobacteria bacterium]